MVPEILRPGQNYLVSTEKVRAKKIVFMDYISDKEILNWLGDTKSDPPHVERIFYASGNFCILALRCDEDFYGKTLREAASKAIMAGVWECRPSCNAMMTINNLIIAAIKGPNDKGELRHRGALGEANYENHQRSERIGLDRSLDRSLEVTGHEHGRSVSRIFKI